MEAGVMYQYHFPVVLFRLNHFGKLPSHFGQHHCQAASREDWHHLGDVEFFSHFQLQSIDKNLSFSNVCNGGGLVIFFSGFRLG